MVPEVRLNFDFTTKLFLHFGLFKLGLVDDLQGDDEAGSPFTRQIDVTEFPFAKWSTDLKVLQAPFLLSSITNRVLLI